MPIKRGSELVETERAKRLARKLKRMTNVQFVKYLMEQGPLAQIFVIDAITKLAEGVAASKPTEYPKDVVNKGADGKTKSITMKMVVDPHAWIATGQMIKKELDTFYKS